MTEFVDAQQQDALVGLAAARGRERKGSRRTNLTPA
jgi:hypothetical protein